ncbi:MAG: hypothetical protein JNM77_14835 [Pseudonocardia sp.]|nr:hypothetical protein [Pseudonocardia sp.]
MSTPDPAARRWAVLDVAAPATLAAVAAAATALPWWQADRGAVLLGTGPVTELPPDTWTGVEMIGPWAVAVAVPAGIAVLAAALAILGSVRAARPAAPSRWAAWAGSFAAAARWAAVAAGLAAVAGAGRVLLGWGASGAAGVWSALAAGLAAGATALPRSAAATGTPSDPARPGARSGTADFAFRLTPSRAAATLALVAAVGLPLAVDQAGVRPHRDAAAPFVPVAAVGAFPLRSGAAGLAAADDVWPVLADGSPGVVSRTGIVVAGPDGRARVLARTDRGAPAPIGVVGDRVVHWTASDVITITQLQAGSPLEVVLRDVTEAGTLGADGSLWLRSDADPVGTVRRLDVAALDGQQRIAVTYLPVVTIQEPDPPVDLRTVLPVPGGGLRTVSGGGRLEMLTGTAAGIATTPLAGSRCGAAGTAGLDHAVADGSGIWFVLAGADGDRLAHLDPNAGSTVRTVPAVLPGAVTALTAPGDGSLLFVARDERGAALWRLPDADEALDPAAAAPVTCPPGP